MLTPLRKWLAPPWRRYGFAVVLAILSTLGSRLLDVATPERGLLVHYPAVTLAGWLVGSGPALLTAALAVATSVSWTGPPFVLVGRDLPYLPALGLFLLNAALMGGLAREAWRAIHGAEVQVLGIERELKDSRLVQKRLQELTGNLRLRVAEQEQVLTEERATRAQADGRAREAQLLAELALTINDALDPERILHPIAAVAREVSGGDIARVALHPRGSDALDVRYQVGGRAEGERLPLKAAVTRAVLATGRPVRLDPAAAGADRDPTGSPGEGGHPLATLAVPIRIGERVAGLICVDNLTDRPFTDRDEAILVSVAAHAAVAIKNAHRIAGEHVARAEAEAASRTKDEFLAMLGHELRNPLGAISNAVHAFHHLGDQATRLQEIITRQTRHLARILDDLLDVARLAAGKIALARQPVDLREIAERAVASLTPEGKATRQEIVLHGESAMVDGDPTRLEQVIRNLLDNAVKFTPEGGHIEVAVARSGERARLRVTDTGVGIPAEVLPRIFDQFFQAESAAAGATGGFGVGLSLVKRLVEAHGGTVSAASAGPGRGSEFVVSLPLLREVPTRPDRDASALPALSPRHVLIIEDNADLRDGLRLLLEGMGHRVEEAADGLRGLELLVNSRADIALIDIGLPGLDGFSLARAMRQAPGPGHTVLVAMTGYGRREDRRRAEETGFTHYLVKPVEEADLLAVLAAIEPRSRAAPAA